MKHLEPGTVAETDLFAGPWGGPAKGEIIRFNSETGRYVIEWYAGRRRGEVDPSDLREVQS